MDHAEAREQLLDRALEPARLLALDTDAGPASAELRAHLATCPACQAELGTWQGTFAALDTAVGADPANRGLRATSLGALAGSAREISLPAGLRARTLAATVAPGPSLVGRVQAARRTVRWPGWLAAAAVLVVLLGGAALVVDRTRQADQARADATALAAVTATLEGIIQDPGHHVALLRTQGGTPAGSVSWSASEGSLVVLTTALQAPAAGQVYRCWIEQGGTSSAVGEMQFSGSTAYWSGSLGSGRYGLSPGGRFWVSLEPIGGGSGGSLVLEGTL